MTNKEIGYRITQARIRAGLTKKELADRTHVSPSTIVRYERGDFEHIKIALIQAFANVTGVSPLWLEGSSDDMEIPSVSNRHETVEKRFGANGFDILSPQEERIVEIFRKLSETGKNRLEKYSRGLCDLEEMEKNVSSDTKE